MRIRVVNSDRVVEVAGDQPVLDAALAASWQLPHGCRGGNCGLCKARLLKGEIQYPHGRPLGLSDVEHAAGFILLCQAIPRSDLDLEVFEVRAAHEHGATRLPCRIERAALVAHDVMLLFLRLPPAVDLRFQAGQYVDIMLPDDRRRSFSIASPPHDARLLELHVRKVAGGELTETLFGNASLPGSLITIEAPLGRFHYREAAAGAGPVLLVGGGTGIAPLLSILRHLIHRDIERQLILYWGVRGTRDLYAEREILHLLSSTPRLRYVPVLSEPPRAWAGRSGLVHAAVLQDVADLGACDIYAAGPPAMIDAVRGEFPRGGARLEHLYCDTFDYASDALERQRASAATKS